MRKLLKQAICVILLTLGGISAALANALVDVNWLKDNIGKPGVVILDIGTPSLAEYMRGHIPGAVYSDFNAKDAWRVTDKAGVPGMLPDQSHLEKLIGSLGIDNASHVVIVPFGANASDMAAATRIYWTFKVVGHDQVSILDGGMAAYAANKANVLEQGNVTPQAKTFKAKMRDDILATKDMVKAALNNKSVQLVDLRPADFYTGITRSGKTKAAGTIPGAKNLPESWLTENDGGKIRSTAELKKLYQVANVSPNGEQIDFCNTGHWGSLGWFVAYEVLGNKKTRLYDGSMAEWTRDSSLPIERKVKLDH